MRSDQAELAVHLVTLLLPGGVSACGTGSVGRFVAMEFDGDDATSFRADELEPVPVLRAQPPATNEASIANTDATNVVRTALLGRRGFGPSVPAT
jgi:hypothetical protein